VPRIDDSGEHGGVMFAIDIDLNLPSAKRGKSGANRVPDCGQ
jgi:hypothetical protein